MTKKYSSETKPSASTGTLQLEHFGSHIPFDEDDDLLQFLNDTMPPTPKERVRSESSWDLFCDLEASHLYSANTPVSAAENNTSLNFTFMESPSFSYTTEFSGDMSPRKFSVNVGSSVHADAKTSKKRKKTTRKKQKRSPIEEYEKASSESDNEVMLVSNKKRTAAQKRKRMKGRFTESEYEFVSITELM